MTAVEFRAPLRMEARQIRRKVIGKSKGCEVCGFSFKAVLVLHHILPVELGGGNRPDNLAVLCPTCHAVTHKLSEANKPLEELGNHVARVMDAGYSETQLMKLARLTKRS